MRTRCTGAQTKKPITPAIDHRLDMGFSKSCAALGALVLISCGSPAELDEQAFPGPEETGYNAVARPPTGSAGSGGTQSVQGAAGNGGVGTGTAGSGSSGVAGSGGVGAAGSSGMMAGGACPSDITVLFNRPVAQGGCTQGGGCHEAGSPTKPDLVSPGLAGRLLNIASSCSRDPSGASVQPRPYISAGDSYLEEKLTLGEQPACGLPMPLLMDYALSATDRECIFNWIDQVAAGGG